MFLCGEIRIITIFGWEKTCYLDTVNYLNLHIKIWQFDRKGLFLHFNLGTFIFSDVHYTIYIY